MKFKQPHHVLAQARNEWMGGRLEDENIENRISAGDTILRELTVPQHGGKGRGTMRTGHALLIAGHHQHGITGILDTVSGPRWLHGVGVDVRPGQMDLLVPSFVNVDNVGDQVE